MGLRREEVAEGEEGVTPIEAMAKALWPDLYDDPSKGAFERAAAYTVEAARARHEAKKRVRAALLALAEVELPLIALHNAMSAFEEHRYGKGGDADDAFKSGFCAMLRAIAEEGKA
jgi:hypothetical protein